jgi:Recombinase
MKLTERIRQSVSGSLDLEQIGKYQSEGWKLTALEWERESSVVQDDEFSAQLQEDPPFGTRVSADSANLEPDPNETDILFAMMELIVQDGPYSRIAEELNQRGYRTRRGSKWSPVSVFEMLPRLIDAGPRIFATDRWHSRRVTRSK